MRARVEGEASHGRTKAVGWHKTAIDFWEQKDVGLRRRAFRTTMDVTRERVRRLITKYLHWALSFVWLDTKWTVVGSEFTGAGLRNLQAELVELSMTRLNNYNDNDRSPKPPVRATYRCHP